MLTNHRPRLLILNVYFSPRSFGGATVVAENMAKKLHRNYGWDILIVTTIEDSSLVPYGMRRYWSDGLDIIGVRVPNFDGSSTDSWNNPNFSRCLATILEHFRPDMVHAHCMQNLGATCLREVTLREIPLAVTIHDCWWICERQFMINHAGRYCNQRTLDLNVCRYCVPDLSATRIRLDGLRTVLSSADLLLFPSEFLRELYILNGFDPERSFVNKNGVVPPGPDFTRLPSSDPEVSLRFGFVGGPGPVKGASLISTALKAMKRTDYELLVVDAADAVGQSWRFDPVWHIPGKVTHVPPYTQATMDDFFRSIDVLLFPSQWKESFGLTVREALIRGIWVVATDAGGVAEDCIDGVNSTVLPFNITAEDLQEAIEGLFDRDLTFDATRATNVRSIDDQAAELNSILQDALMPGRYQPLAKGR